MSTPEVVREAQSTEAYNPLAKQKAAAKLSRIPDQGRTRRSAQEARLDPREGGQPTTRFYEIKEILREHKLHTVCEEASCPNIGECFGKGTATFMIMGDKCTRRCPFCDVGHGRPDPLDKDEPLNLARTIAALELKYVVITSVDRDDLRDGGSGHFVECIQRIRELSPSTQIEILTPDFRGRDDRALEILKAAPPDVMNHNLETAPRLYKEARPGSDYQFSLNLLKKFKELHPNVPTKSGIMVGLGETDEEILQVMRDMRAAQHRHADDWPVPSAQQQPPARAPLRPPRHLQDVRGRGLQDGLQFTPPWAPWCAAATTPTSRPTPLACKPGRSTTQPPCSPPPQMPCHCGAGAFARQPTATITSRCCSAWRARWSWRLKAEGSAWPRAKAA